MPRPRRSSGLPLSVAPTLTDATRRRSALSGAGVVVGAGAAVTAGVATATPPDAATGTDGAVGAAGIPGVWSGVAAAWRRRAVPAACGWPEGWLARRAAADAAARRPAASAPLGPRVGRAAGCLTGFAVRAIGGRLTASAAVSGGWPGHDMPSIGATTTARPTRQATRRAPTVRPATTSLRRAVFTKLGIGIP